MLINETAKLSRLLVTVISLWGLCPKTVVICNMASFVGPDVKHMVTYYNRDELQVHEG